MAARSPRHLADRANRFGLPPWQLVVGGAALAAALVAVAVRGDGTRRQASATTRPADPTATTAPAARALRPMPGNLVANADFERDLAGWTAVGPARLDRVAGGSSGRWAVAVRPGGTGSGPPGLARPEVTRARAGTTYEGSAWVRAAAGAQVVLTLREHDGDREISADVAGYTLAGDGWQQVGVEHRTRAPGSRLGMEITGAVFSGGQPLLVDAVEVHPELE
jgi:hypothetical protein